MYFFPGLYPEQHQIIGNYMYDRLNNDFFNLDEAETTGKSKWWSGHIPIWTTLTRQGF